MEIDVEAYENREQNRAFAQAMEEQEMLRARMGAYKTGLEERIETGPQFENFKWLKGDAKEVWGGMVAGYFVGSFLPGVEGWHGAIAGGTYALLKKLYKDSRDNELEG